MTAIFKLKDGSLVEVESIDPQPDLGLGIRYHFIITNTNGEEKSFVYTPISSMNEMQRNEGSNGTITMTENEALLIFQNEYER